MVFDSILQYCVVYSYFFTLFSLSHLFFDQNSRVLWGLIRTNINSVCYVFAMEWVHLWSRPTIMACKKTIVQCTFVYIKFDYCKTETILKYGSIRCQLFTWIRHPYWNTAAAATTINNTIKRVIPQYYCFDRIRMQMKIKRDKEGDGKTESNG